MAYINDTVFDNGLTTLQSNANKILISTTDPAGVYATATANQLGNKTVTCTGPANATSGTGRQVKVNAITSGTITATGTAAYWALVSTAGTLYADGALTTTQVLSSTANTFTLDAIQIAVRDAT